MEPQFERYLDDIEVPAPQKDRIDQLLRDYTPLFSEPLEQIFVSDLFDGTNIRRFLNVWLFSKNRAMEIRNFLGAETIDFVRVTQNVVYIELGKTNFDFLTANPLSRLVVTGRFSPGALTFQIQAAANNCMVLGDIIRARLLPNLVSKR